MLTQETPARLPLLDYHKPPEGYLVHDLNDDGWWWRIDEPEDGCTAPFETEAEATDAAWSHFKVHNDPPGCSIGLVMKGQGATTRGDFVVDWGASQVASVPAYNGKAQRAGAYQEARAAAWAWHDRRLGLILLLAAQMGGMLGREAEEDLLAKALAWTDADCAEMDIFLRTPCPPDVNPYREGPACLMLAVWGPGWKPPAVNHQPPDCPPQMAEIYEDQGLTMHAIRDAAAELERNSVKPDADGMIAVPVLGVEDVP